MYLIFDHLANCRFSFFLNIFSVFVHQHIYQNFETLGNAKYLDDDEERV